FRRRYCWWAPRKVRSWLKMWRAWQPFGFHRTGKHNKPRMGPEFCLAAVRTDLPLASSQTPAACDDRKAKAQIHAKASSDPGLLAGGNTRLGQSAFAMDPAFDSARGYHGDQGGSDFLGRRSSQQECPHAGLSRL